MTLSHRKSHQSNMSIEMQERIIETEAWTRARGIEVDSDKCRVCSKFKESVDYLLARREKIAGNEYVKRHNNDVDGNDSRMKKR